MSSQTDTCAESLAGPAYEEEHSYIKGVLGNLYAINYTPHVKSAKKRGFIILHPFGEEKKSAHRFLVELSRALASAGFNILQFDIYGFGDSQGKCADATVATWLADLENIYKTFSEESGSDDIGIIGLRFGAYLGILSVLESRLDIKTLILLEPVLDGMKFFNKILRSKYIKEFQTSGNKYSDDKSLLTDLDNNNSIDVDGYEITRTFYEELKGYQSRMYFERLDVGKVRLFRISPFGKLTKEINSLVKGRIDSGNNPVHIEVVKSLPFWETLEPMPFGAIIDSIVDVV